MIIYEIFSRAKDGQHEFIAALPERRMKMNRVTSNYVENWFKAVFSNITDTDDIFVVRKII